MALVNCPECGRTNISNTAEQCPECGYAVKKHFEKENQKQIQQIEIEKLKKELQLKINEIDNMSPPQKPKIKIASFIGFIICLGLSLFALILGIINPNGEDDIGKLLLISAFLFFLSLLAIWGTYDDFKKAKTAYIEQTTDWQGYKNKCKEKLKEEYIYYAKNIVKYGDKYGILNQDIRFCTVCHKKISKNAETCPHCGQKTGVHVCPKCRSTNTKIITGASKAASVAMWGVFAANKVKSNYQCNNCGHKF